MEMIYHYRNLNKQQQADLLDELDPEEIVDKIYDMKSEDTGEYTESLIVRPGKKSKQQKVEQEVERYEKIAAQIQSEHSKPLVL